MKKLLHYSLAYLLTALAIFLSSFFREYPLLAQNVVTITDPGDEKKEDEETTSPSGHDTEKASIHLSVCTTANTKDIFIGGSLDAPFGGKNLFLLRAMFFWRPYEKNVILEDDNDQTDFYYQLKERRYTGVLALEKQFFLSDSMGMFINGGAGFTYADYSGVKNMNETDFAPMFTCGLLYGSFIGIKVGYQYLKIPHVPNNRGYAEIYLKF